MTDRPFDAILGSKHENVDRPLYVADRPVPFGKFAVKRFPPVVQKEIDWHGHVEVNWLTGGSMTYRFDGRKVILPPGQLAIFWAGIPHQAIEILPSGEGSMSLCNMYFPLDAFLFMKGIVPIQRALLDGAFLTLPRTAVDGVLMDRWLLDYESESEDRYECLCLEFNALLRRASLQPSLVDLRTGTAYARKPGPTASNIGHVIKMIEAVAGLSGQSVTVKDIARQTGLNVNYASNLFAKTLGISLKKFIIRMTLMRARLLLLETDLPVQQVAYESGFNSVSQFYTQFQAQYGTSPAVIRNSLAS